MPEEQLKGKSVDPTLLSRARSRDGTELRVCETRRISKPDLSGDSAPDDAQVESSRQAYCGQEPVPVVEHKARAPLRAYMHTKYAIGCRLYGRADPN